MKKFLSIAIVSLSLIACSKEQPIINEPEPEDKFSVSYNPFTRSVAADTVARYTVTFSGNYGYDSPIKVSQHFCYWLSERIEGEIIKRNGIVCYVELPAREVEKFLSLLKIVTAQFELKEEN